jgi:hypothetical protein
MASSGQVSAAVAKAVGVPLETVTVIVRYLRESGAIAVSGRGLSAAKFSFLDIAKVLIATVASDQPKEAVEVTANYVDLRSKQGGISRLQYERPKPTTPEPWFDKRKSPTFGLAVAELIGGAYEGDLTPLIPRTWSGRPAELRAVWTKPPLAGQQHQDPEAWPELVLAFDTVRSLVSDQVVQSAIIRQRLTDGYERRRMFYQGTHPISSRNMRLIDSTFPSGARTIRKTLHLASFLYLAAELKSYDN